MALTRAIVDKLLTQASSMYMPDGYICEKILPVVNVVQKSGKLAKYGTNHLRLESTIGGGRGEYRRVETITRTTDTYYVESHGLEDIVTADDYSNCELPYNCESDVVLGLTNLLFLQKEKALADAITSTSIIANNVTLSGTDQLNDYTNSDPIGVFHDAKTAIYEECGMLPNIAVMDWSVFDTIKNHTLLMKPLGYAYNRAGGLSEVELASAMGVDMVVVAKGLYESANEGQSSSLSPIWGKHIVFMVAPQTAGLRQTSLGYRVQLAGRPARQVYKYAVNNPPNSTGIIVEDHYDHFISNAGAAYLVKNAIA